MLKKYKFYASLKSASLKTNTDFELYFLNSSVSHCVNNFSALFQSYQFEEKFATCSNYSLIQRNKIEITVLNIYFLFEWLKLIMEVYTKNVLTILGLITNLLIMGVIKNSVFHKTFNNAMYKHIFYNSMFNSILCFLNCFSLMNICIFAQSSFCSSIYKTNGAQYFKIIFIHFLGNSLRLCCNFSFILFSVSRFYILMAIKSKIVQTYEKFNLNFFYLIMFVSCSLWSMFQTCAESHFF